MSKRKAYNGYLRAQEKVEEALTKLKEQYRIAEEKGKKRKCKNLSKKIALKERALARLGKNVKEAKQKLIKKELKSRDKRILKDKSPYKIIVIKEDSIKETKIDRKGFDNMVSSVKRRVAADLDEGRKPWAGKMILTKFGAAEAIILDMVGHIQTNSSTEIELTNKDRVALAEFMYLDQKSASMLAYTPISVAAGVMFGGSVAMSILWILKFIVLNWVLS